MTATGVVPECDELVGRARDLQPLLREFAEYGDTHRRTADEVIGALTDAGMFRLFTPRRFGGYQVGLGTLLSVAETLGEADGSAAWLVAVAASATSVAAHAPQATLDEVFGADPDARLAGGGAGAGTGRLVDGGVVVSGTWNDASGSAHASWAEVLTALVDEHGDSAGPAFVLMPITDVRVEDTWRTDGLRGTSTNTLVADEVFVPDHRLIPAAALDGGSRPDLDPLYRLPMQVAGVVAFVGPLLGVGRAALDHVIDRAAAKGISHTVFRTKSESVGVQLQVADAALKLRTASLHVHSVADTAMHHVSAGQPLTAVYQAQALAEVAHAVQHILDAVNLLATIHGSSSLADGNPMRRLVQDVGIGARHAAFNHTVHREVLGKALLGVDETILSL